jgi:hypothetical protein
MQSANNVQQQQQQEEEQQQQNLPKAQNKLARPCREGMKFRVANKV